MSNRFPTTSDRNTANKLYNDQNIHKGYHQPKFGKQTRSNTFHMNNVPYMNYEERTDIKVNTF